MQEENKVVCNKQLERVYLLNVLLYIDSLESVKKFIQINKKCQEVSTMIRMYTKRRVRDDDFKEEATIPQNLFTIFPMIETIRCDERDLIDFQNVLDQTTFIELDANTYNEMDSYKRNNIPLRNREKVRILVLFSEENISAFHH